MTPLAGLLLLLFMLSAFSLGGRLFSADAASRLLSGPTTAGPWSRVSPPARLAAVLLFALATGLTPLHRLWAPAMAVVAALLLGRVPLRALVQRLAPILPFILLASAGALLGSHQQAALTAVCRALLVASALAVFGSVTSLAETVAAARGLGLPRQLVAVLALTVRYLALLVEEAERVGHAFTARAVGRRDWRLARPLGLAVGALAIRSLDRAERVHLGMLARGFNGELPTLSQRPWRAIEVLGLLLLGAALLAAAYAP